MTIKYHSQIEQDKFYIENIVIPHQISKGTFLDIGAHNGIQLSNTYTLEKEYGWTGLCIESNVDLLPQLTENRPNSVCANATTWSANTTLTIDISDCGLKWGDEVTRVSHIPHNENHFKEAFSQKIVRKVAASTLTDILDKYNYQFYNEGLGCYHFNYMSLDVEGAELETLKGIPWDEIEIEYCTIEHGCVNLNKDSRADYLNEIIKFMTFQDYYVSRINKWDIEFMSYDFAISSRSLNLPLSV